MSEWQINLAGMVAGAVIWLWWDWWREAARAKTTPLPNYQEQAEAMVKANPQAIIAFSDTLPPTAVGRVVIVNKQKPRKPRSDKRRKKKPGRKEVDIQGQRFGLLTAVRRDGTIYKSKQPAWIFRCDCGNVIRAAKAGIAYPSSEQVSCGCWKRESDAYNAAKASAAAAAKRKEMH